MNILILNDLLLENAPYHDWFEGYADNLYLISSPNYFKNQPEAGEKTLEKYQKYIFLNNFSLNGMVTQQAIEWVKKYKIDRVVALAEFDIERAAYIREACGLAGQLPISASAFRDKFVMKDYVAQSGVTIPEYYPVDDMGQLLDAVNKVQFPCVLKFRCGGGSEGTRILKNEEDFNACITTLFNSLERANLMLESFVEGEMYHVDGIVVHDEIYSIWPSLYINGCLAFQENKSLASYTLDKHNPLTKKLIEATKKVLNSLPSPTSFGFHAEFFVTPQGEIVFCEIASRIGGAGVVEAYEGAMGLHLEHTFALCQIDAVERNNIEIRKVNSELFGWCLIPPKESTLIYAPSSCNYDWVHEYKLHSQIGVTGDKATCSVSKAAHFIFSGESEAELQQKVNEINLWFEKSVLWNQE